MLRRYELSNHLGNVLATVSDKSLGQDSSQTGQADYYLAQVSSASLYYPFGWEMPGRKFVSGEGYRFGFNGQEDDRDWGTQNIQDYGFRLYNPSIGKFLSEDPLAPEYPWYTPYQFAGNMPIQCIDLDGLEQFPANKDLSYKKKYPIFHKMITTGFFNKHILDSKSTLEVLDRYSVGMLTPEQIEADINSGPYIIVVENNVLYNGNTTYGKNYRIPESKENSITILINEALINNMEEILADEKSSYVAKRLSIFAVYQTFLNEYVQYGDALDELDAIEVEEGGAVINGTQSDFEEDGLYTSKEFDEGNAAVTELFGQTPVNNKDNPRKMMQDLYEIYKHQNATTGDPDLPSAYQPDPSKIPSVPK